jgi:hypothetical protein
MPTVVAPTLNMVVVRRMAQFAALSSSLQPSPLITAPHFPGVRTVGQESFFHAPPAATRSWNRLSDYEAQTFPAEMPQAVATTMPSLSPAPAIRTASASAAVAAARTVSYTGLLGAGLVVIMLKGLPALNGLGAFYSAAAISSPLACAAVTATVKGVCSDTFAQLVVERYVARAPTRCSPRRR